MDESFEKDLDAIARIDVVPRILEVVCRTTGLGFSAVARVTESRWIACAVRDEIAFGLAPGGELEIQTTICNEIRESGELVVIDHVAEDAAFCRHPTPQRYGFQSYISVPITLPGGQFFGTLCGIDPRPARLKDSGTVEMFKLFADLIATHLDAQQRVVASEAALLGEREAAQLREQFIAVLGHDLRNPLAAITSGADILRLLPHDAEAGEVIDLIQRSTGRMAGLIDNVLDLARGRLGGGLALQRRMDDGLEAALRQVVTELQTAWPARTIRHDLSVGRPVYCDSARVAQMLSNLLANALTHGAPDAPVTVLAHTDPAGFELSVTNAGEPIPPHIVDRLFEPFARGSARPGQQGLGLGLYIASEIAKAHGGSLGVESTAGRTTFTFRMPARGA